MTNEVLTLLEPRHSEKEVETVDFKDDLGCSEDNNSYKKVDTVDSRHSEDVHGHWGRQSTDSGLRLRPFFVSDSCCEEGKGCPGLARPQAKTFKRNYYHG